ncbi:MAG: hypothetical protein ACKV1O_30910 [Saprospiraceae bacterium]
MKILKRPENIVFDTENPDKMDFTPMPTHGLTPLHQTIVETEWDFLTQFFAGIAGYDHPIFKDFGQSYFYCI